MKYVLEHYLKPFFKTFAVYSYTKLKAKMMELK